MRLQDLIAKIGGFFNSIYLVVFALSFHYIRFLYMRKLYEETSQISTTKL